MIADILVEHPYFRSFDVAREQRFSIFAAQLFQHVKCSEVSTTQVLNGRRHRTLCVRFFLLFAQSLFFLHFFLTILVVVQQRLMHIQSVVLERCSHQYRTTRIYAFRRARVRHALCRAQVGNKRDHLSGYARAKARTNVLARALHL